MSLNREQIKSIEKTIKDSMQKKFLMYAPETSYMPFQHRLLGHDRMHLFSFIHSLNTTFGTSIFEPVAETMAKLNFVLAEKQFEVGDLISEHAQIEIQNILDELATGEKKSNKIVEIERISKVCSKGEMRKTKAVKADLFAQSEDGTVHLFDLKTAKPNISNFRDFKRTLLEWIAIYLVKHPGVKVNSYIAIPYNPYEPDKYTRWTLGGMLDLDNELMVGKDFWDFLGGEGAYTELLNCFERVGIELNSEIDQYFQKFK